MTKVSIILSLLTDDLH